MCHNLVTNRPYEKLDICEWCLPKEDCKDITETKVFVLSQVLAVKGEMLIESIKADNPTSAQTTEAVNSLQDSIRNYYKTFKGNK